MSRPGEGRMYLPSVLDMIAEHGPISAHGIATMTDIDPTGVRASIRYARRNGLIYVAGHERDGTTRGPWASLYAIGQRRDARPPVNDKTAYQRRYYEQRRAAKVLKARAHYRAKTGRAAADPFAQAVKIFEIGGAGRAHGET